MTPDEKYIQILEKTNQQLSMAHNPYGIMVGILTILIAFLSIAAIIIIYRQGRDYQSKLEKDRTELRKKFDDFLDSQMAIIKEKNETADKLNKKVDLIINEYKKQLEESSASQKNEIQQIIDKLELEKISLSKNTGPMTVTPNSNYGSSIGSPFLKLCKCPHCGYGFNVDVLSPAASFSMFGNKTVTCPQCGSLCEV